MPITATRHSIAPSPIARPSIACARIVWLCGFGAALLAAGCGDDAQRGPEVVIDEAPAELSSATRVQVVFRATSDVALASFGCKLDDRAAAACTSPWIFDVSDGAHTVAITAITDDGTAGAPATASFTTDTAPPNTMITSGPTDVETSTLASFAFTAVAPAGGETFECSVDSDGFLPCSSPVGVTRPNGAHTFRVRAIDRAGNIDPTPALHAWAIDTEGPRLLLNARPSNPSNDNTPSFDFSSPDANVTFACAIDGVLDFTACTTVFTAPALLDGAHTFRLRATEGTPNSTTLVYTWTVDTAAPEITITGGPTGTTQDTSPTFTFTVTGDPVSVQCRIDNEPFAACTSPFTTTELAAGPHTFELAADDTAGNTGSASQAFTVDATPGSCGDGVINGDEVCDGGSLDGATCESLGHAPGTLACAATCDAFVVTGCDGGFVAAGDGLTGKVCIDGVKFSRAPSVFVAACTEDAGVWKASLGAGAITWASANGTTAGTMVTNQHGRAVITALDNPSVVFLTDSTTPVNGLRSNNFESTTQPPSATSWNNQIAFASGGAPLELFTARVGSNVNNIVAGWHPTLGAVVAHGNFNTNATVSAVGANVTGTVTAVAFGPLSLPSSDINVAVLGQTPSGALALGGGIYWACDQQGAAGGTYAARDAGIAVSDKHLIGALIADPASFTSGTRTCPATGQMVGGYATTYYAGLRGGGQIYKTTDAGESWAQRNTGLPAGAEVYALAIDCSQFRDGFPNLCVDHERLFAATSMGLYTSSDGGAHWALAGLEGKSVRAVTVIPDHPEGTAPRIFVGVDDASGIYQRP